MKRYALLTFAILMMPCLASAQDTPDVEIGTNFGVSIVTADGSTITQFGIPGQGVLGQPIIYTTFFAGSVMLEPQIAFNLTTSGGSTFTTLGIGGQAGYLFSGSTTDSPYVVTALGFQLIANGSTSTDFGLGGKVGYRVLIGEGVGFRVEGGYRRWLDNQLNEITIGFGIGAIIH